ncbi:terminal uridylyltransferase Tailor-like [Drosophila sulfurigaster albostrigata]|uniref:terminal uridylyltransferase Tailor-like n=1 Tax=Drosophila sulfurigaster albostrigata TaxID=89887 RepID=UPI002D21EB5B|nr:terminal uridylyltransferase Tailor-like [Drosophila sulfurigaster albostrigata]
MTSNVEFRQTKSNLPLGQDNAANCTVCDASFKTLQECLAHELLKHTIMTLTKLPKRLGAISKLSASEQTQSERRLLEELLVQLPPGQQLKAVLSFYAGNSAKLEECFVEVRKDIENQLHGIPLAIYPYGSFVTGLALKDSDIDLYLKSIDGNSNAMSHSQLYEEINRLLRHTDCFSDVIAIRNAGVPIIRFKHVASGLRLDINMSHPNGIHNSRFVAELLNRDVRLRELFLFVKIWAKKLLIIGKAMTSYCLITLIIYQLQQQRHLPSIKKLQSGIPVSDVGGINYAYNLEHVPALPDFLTTFDLISGFFDLYSDMDFEKKMLSPYLGHALDVEAAFTVPGNFPEYNAQVLAIETARQERIKPFNVECDVFVQDPFDLSRNLGQYISKTQLSYLNQCLAAANEACNDAKLKSTPPKFYDYLLFGLAEHLVEEHRLGYVLPAKQRQQLTKKAVKTADALPKRMNANRCQRKQ